MRCQTWSVVLLRYRGYFMCIKQQTICGVLLHVYKTTFYTHEVEELTNRGMVLKVPLYHELGFSGAVLFQSHMCKPYFLLQNVLQLLFFFQFYDLWFLFTVIVFMTPKSQFYSFCLFACARKYFPV